MTATMARLVLAMLLLPATGAVFLLTFFAVVRPFGPPGLGRISFVWMIVYSFVGAYWVLLWRSEVRWNGRRIAQTGVATVIALACGAAAGCLVKIAGPWVPVQLVVLIGGGTVPIVWVLGTVLVWRETPRERAERLSARAGAVVCPLCGYNLAGLRESRCPECGTSFTLDQLVAAQPPAAVPHAEL